MSLTHLRKKEIFDELANERMSEIQNLSKQINFNNLIYYFKGESGSKTFIGFEGPLRFYESMRDGYATLEKDEEDQEIRCKLNNKREAKIRRAGKSNKNIKTL